MKYKLFIRNLIIIVVIFLVGFFVHIDYYVMRPSRAVNLSEIVKLDRADLEDREIFYLLTVTQQRASLFTAAYGYIHPHMDLNPKEKVIPRQMDEEEYRELLREHMLESQHIAQVVALRRAGYDVDIESDGVEVIDFLEDAPAEGSLAVGDKITGVDQKDVFLASEVPIIVQDRQVGESVDMSIVRNGQELDITVPSGQHPDDEDMAFLGVYIQTLPWEPVLPVEIEIDTANIGGPSAGLMFVLEIIDQMSDEDITGGEAVAGTGTIDLDENVGAIGGVTQKVAAAEGAGIDYIIIPENNYEAAKLVAKDIQVVPVSELEDALQFLSTLDSNFDFENYDQDPVDLD